MKLIAPFLVLPFVAVALVLPDSLSVNKSRSIQPIPGFETDSIKTDSTIADTLVSKFDPINNGFLMGARWRFTSSDVFREWDNQQRTYMENVVARYRITNPEMRIQWLMKPETQSFAFPITVGYFHRIDSTKSITVAASYGFRRQRAVFSVFNDTVRVTVFDNVSKIVNHETDIQVSYQFRFNSEYFSVAGIERAGVSLSAGIIPFSSFSVNTTSQEPNYERSESMSGFGGSWGVGIFTEKQISERMLAQFFFNYRGNVTYGYSNKKNLFKLQVTDVVSEKRSKMSENQFELGFQTILSKKKSKEIPVK